MLPQVIMEGRAIADPELRFSNSGVAIGTVRLVASSRKKDESGDWVDDKTCFIDVTAFKRLAENMVESFRKGDLITVTGKLQQDQWEKDGQKYSKHKIVADTIGASVAFRQVRHQSGEGGGGGGVERTTTPSAEDPWTTPIPDAPAQNDDPPF